MSANNQACSKTSKRNRFLIIDLCNPLSLGGAAIVLSLTKLLESGFPKSEIIGVVSRERDRVIYQKTYGLRQMTLVSHLWYKERQTMAKTVLHSFMPLCIGLIKTVTSSLLMKLKLSTGDLFARSDVIIDLNSDAINEHYGIVYPLFALLNITFASLSGKPVVVAPCSIGTFKNPVARLFASFALNRSRVIVVREPISIDHLNRLNVSKPKIAFASDLAFLFDPEDADETKKKLAKLGIDKEKRPLIGITPSQIIHYYAFKGENEIRSKKRIRYINLMAEFTDFLVEKIGATVMLVPHSYSETGDLASFADVDDRNACRDIYTKVRNREHVRPVLESYGTDKIKGLIGSCDMFIACRMHASIAATSQCVPTIVLSYGTKFEGIIGELINQRDQIVNISEDYDTVLDQLKTKAMKTWDDRRSIRRSLQSTLPQVQKSARSLLISLCQSPENNDRSKS